MFLDSLNLPRFGRQQGRLVSVSVLLRLRKFWQVNRMTGLVPKLGILPIFQEIRTPVDREYYARSFLHGKRPAPSWKTGNLLTSIIASAAVGICSAPTTFSSHSPRAVCSSHLLYPLPLRPQHLHPPIASTIPPNSHPHWRSPPTLFPDHITPSPFWL